MDQVSQADFLSALGEEFCWALSPPLSSGSMVPQDGYEVWFRSFGTTPTPEQLAGLTDGQVEQLRAECAAYFECPQITVSAVRHAISRTLARWPVEKHRLKDTLGGG